MKRVFIYALLALATGAYLAELMRNEPGYVLIAFGDYSVELTLVALLLAMALLAALSYGLAWLLMRLNPLKLLRRDTWRALGLGKSAAAASQEGLHMLLHGHWQEAYQLLLENAEQVENPLFNYLAACYAALQRGDAAAWNYCLGQLEQNGGVPASALKGLKAALYYHGGLVEQSLALALAMEKEAPGSPHALNLLRQNYQALGDWEKLSQLLPRLEKHRVLNGDELRRLQEQAALHGLERITPAQGGYPSLARFWEQLPKKQRGRESLALMYARKLLLFGKDDEALEVAAEYLKSQWSDKLAELVGFMGGKSQAQQLVYARNWLKARPNNAALLLTLGRASLRNGLWGQAKEYLSSALRFSRDPALSADINAELARLLENSGEHESSVSHYGRALELLDHKLPDLPMPEPKQSG